MSSSDARSPSQLDTQYGVSQRGRRVKLRKHRSPRLCCSRMAGMKYTHAHVCTHTCASTTHTQVNAQHTQSRWDAGARRGADSWPRHLVAVSLGKGTALLAALPGDGAALTGPPSQAGGQLTWTSGLRQHLPHPQLRNAGSRHRGCLRK